MKVALLITACSLSLLAACGAKKEEFNALRFDQKCVTSAGNGVYKLNGPSCPFDTSEEVLAQFIGFHPELEIIHMSVDNSAFVYIITKNNTPR